MDQIIAFRYKLQSARSKEELETLTIELANALKDRYKPVHILAEEGNADVLERRNFLTEMASGRILDVGCFDGYYSIEIAKKGHQVVGLDMLQLCIDYARNRSDNQCINVKFIKGFAEDLPFKDNYFDTTILSHTLEHVFDDKKALSESARVTVSRGRIIIILPRERGNDPTHLRYIPSQEIRDRLSLYGSVSNELRIGKGIGYICNLK
ncbi:methyltransferase domain-containing protein [Candidatus Pacearchaeota archaeon]|nr:methyltransferase domain-containing protein [Candidatus Pacearchaeota archaeon]